MKSFWKRGLILAFIVLLVGGSAALWHLHKQRIFEKDLVDLASACRTRAEQGDPKAESELAYMYSHSQGVPQDFSEALRWRRKSAERGYAAGEVGLGYMYLHGQGVPQNNSEALNWYRRAADSGDAYAENNLAIIYEEGGLVAQDYAEALRWYRKAAEQNYPAAQFNLGSMYYYGRGVQRDVAEASRWYHKAAAHGDEYSQRFLGLRGRGLSATDTIIISICALGSLLLLVGPLFPKGNSLNRPSQLTTTAGLVGLCCVGLDVYAHSQFSVFPSELIVSGFTFVRYVLTGVFLFLLISVLTPLTMKMSLVLLGILGASFLSFNVWTFTSVTLNHVLLNFPAAARAFWSINGLMVGMAISLGVRLLRNKANEGLSRNSEEGTG